VILVSVTSALVAVFAMLLVATLNRSRRKDDEPTPKEREKED
jgi:hypothetical protein